MIDARNVSSWLSVKGRLAEMSVNTDQISNPFARSNFPTRRESRFLIGLSSLALGSLPAVK